MSGEADSADIRVCKKWECSKPCVLCYGLSTEGGLSCKSRPSCGEDFVCFISGGGGGTCQSSMCIASKLKWLGFFCVCHNSVCPVKKLLQVGYPECTKCVCEWMHITEIVSQMTHCILYYVLNIVVYEFYKVVIQFWWPQSDNPFQSTTQESCDRWVREVSNILQLVFFD